MIYIILFILFYVFALFAEQNKNKQLRNNILVLSCVVLAFVAGMRDAYSWPDALVYMHSFQSSPNIFNFSFSDHIIGYSEQGFYLVSVIVRTFSDNYHVFFLVIALLSFFFLYKNLKEYSIYPLIGLCAYISRFYTNRNFVQIRAGLSYVILLLGVKYILKKDWKRYFLIVFIAWLFHKSAIAAIPLYFFCNWMNLKKKHVVIALIVSFFIGIWGQSWMHTLIEDNASDLNIIRYSEAGGEHRQLEGLGMRNPMIYYQCLLLLMFTFLEKRLAPLSKYYYVIRTAYLYSTMILICFCTYKVLSARTSSMFATLEFSIIPSLVFIFNKRNRFWAFVMMGVALVSIFYLYQYR